MLGRTLENVKSMREESADTVMMRPIETRVVLRAPTPAHPHPRQVRNQAKAAKERERKEKENENEVKRRLLTGRRYHASSSYVASATKAMRATSSTTSKSRKNSKRRERRTRIFTRAGPEPSGR